jgi:pimeloyl-ACP methyl ester carboxylesterase
MSVVTLEGEIIHYEVLGRGRPLIYLHSWIGSWRYWVPAMQATSISYRSYALDLYGFGDTAKRPSMYALDSQVKLINDFMEYMGIGKIALVGHGLGAAVAMKFAANYPGVVDRLLLSSLPSDAAVINPRLRTASLPELVDWILGRQPGADSARTEAAKADLLAIQTSLSNLEEANINQIFTALATPCLFVYGQNDPAVQIPPEETFDGMPEHTHYILFEQSGHFPMLEETNKFNRLLGDFLALGSGESPRQLQLKEEWKRRIR